MASRICLCSAIVASKRSREVWLNSWNMDRMSGVIIAKSERSTELPAASAIFRWKIISSSNPLFPVVALTSYRRSSSRNSSSIRSSAHEVQDYIILTGHMTDGFYTLIGDHIWSNMSQAEQAVFNEIYQEAAKNTTDDILAEEKNLVQWFEDQGIKVIEVDRSLFIDAVSGSMVGDDLPWTQEQIDELLAL